MPISHHCRHCGQRLSVEQAGEARASFSALLSAAPRAQREADFAEDLSIVRFSFRHRTG
jgi:hypothetical protein